MSNRLRVLRLVISALAICLVATPVLAGPARDKKADKALRGALKGRTEQHTVILRVKPGTRRQIRQAIEQCGGVVKKEHQLIDALTVNLQGNCLDAHPRKPEREVRGQRRQRDVHSGRRIQ